MFKTIIVGTDGSPTAQRAVTEAIKLAQLAKAELHITTADNDTISDAVGAFVPASGGLDPERVIDELSSTVNNAAEEARATGINVKTHTMRGNATEALCGLAEEIGADLIVVGNRGMKGIQRFFLDSVPNAVSHRAPCSVLLVDTTSEA